MDKKQELTHKALLFNTDINPYITFDDLELMFNHRIEIRALRLFFSGDSFTKKSLTKLLGCDHKTTIRIVECFHRLGIIKRIIDSYSLYVLNRESNIVKSFMWMLSHTRYKS